MCHIVTQTLNTQDIQACKGNLGTKRGLESRLKSTCIDVATTTPKTHLQLIQKCTYSTIKWCILMETEWNSTALPAGTTHSGSSHTVGSPIKPQAAFQDLPELHTPLHLHPTCSVPVAACLQESFVPSSCFPQSCTLPKLPSPRHCRSDSPFCSNDRQSMIGKGHKQI